MIRFKGATFSNLSILACLTDNDLIVLEQLLILALTSPLEKQFNQYPT